MLACIREESLANISIENCIIIIDDSTGNRCASLGKHHRSSLNDVMVHELCSIMNAVECLKKYA